MNRAYLPHVLAALVFLGAASAASPARAEEAEELAVFVNKKVQVDALSIAEIKGIFLKQRTTWEKGRTIVCVNANEEARARAAFRSKVLEMSYEDEQEYWRNQKMRGGTSEPATFSNTVKAVFSLPGGISYAFKKDVPADVVKVIATVK